MKSPATVLLTALIRFLQRKTVSKNGVPLMANPPERLCEPIVAADPRTGGKVL